MALDVSVLIKVLKDHIKACEFPAVDALVDDAIVALAQDRAIFDAKQRKAVLGALRGARQFDCLGRMAQALMLAGHDDPANPEFDPMVRRQYAQSLIEAGQMSAATDTLGHGLALIAAVPEAAFAAHKSEHEETSGLLGRVHKQIYVDAHARNVKAKQSAGQLAAAAFWYDTAAVNRPAARAHWPLINMVAMAARAERDGQPAPFAKASRAMAAELIASLLPEASSDNPADKGDQPWLRASLGEAYVAMQDWPNAAKWYAAYSDGPYVDAFDVHSTLRQLLQVWQIAPDSPNGDGQLVRLLAAALSRKPGGSVALSSTIARVLAGDDELVKQAIIGTNLPKTLNWLREGFKRAPSVAGVFRAGRRQPIGTAFLIEGGHLHPALGNRIVALTAAHVVSRYGRLRPREAALRFTEHEDQAREFKIEELYSSPPDTLDFCILGLKEPVPGATPVSIRPFSEMPDKVSGFGDDSVCSTIGHADGDDLALSYSKLVDIGPKRSKPLQHVFLRYAASTMGGNSGGPVYDDDWNVIGMHQAGIKPERVATGIQPLGDKTEPQVANEGVSLQSIAIELGARWESAPTRKVAPKAMQSKWQQLEAAIVAGEMPESEVAELFDNMEPADFPAESKSATAPAAAPAAPAAIAGRDGEITREAYRNVGDLFWYGGAVALSKAFRKRRNALFSQSRDRYGNSLTLVSEGDSWFQYPKPGVRDVIDHLSDIYPIYCRAIAGMEFEKIFANTTDLMAAVREHKPDGILLSGGGNDLLGDGVVANYVFEFDAARQPADYLRPLLDKKIDIIIAFFDALVGKALAIDPKLQFFVHGYDHVLPRRGQSWLNLPLRETCGVKSLPLQKQIVAAMVDRFNGRLAKFAATRPGAVHYVDCRGTVGDKAGDWSDELHPQSAGFGRVAEAFDFAIRRAFKDHPSIKSDAKAAGRDAA